MRRAAAATTFTILTALALSGLFHLTRRPDFERPRKHEAASSSPARALRCAPGIYLNASQWRSLFPAPLPLRGRALVAMPIGRRARSFIAALVERLEHRAFDYLFFAYDSTPWEDEPWFRRQGVSVKRTPGGRKWALYYDFLRDDAATAAYTHLFLWDDDVLPTPKFDGEVLLQLVQALGINASQPMIRRNSHGKDLEGSYVRHRLNTHEPLHEMRSVEIQVPVLSTAFWSCLRPHLVQHGGTGWGIDTFLFNHLPCAPSRFYSIRLPLDHADQRGLEKRDASKEYEAYRRAVAGLPRRNDQGPPFRNFEVRVDASCNISTGDSDALRRGPRKIRGARLN